ncbi:unnamed protein product [Protopolystoma xenopodis]|uniref:Uncharacterized protein n=1 Tax=Protopolystoma xenopodis TaxID=117903 RepID=A0A3S5C463_9PLAT|nr:unnamed protein product [Protopolystoma xenopodis]
MRENVANFTVSDDASSLSSLLSLESAGLEHSLLQECISSAMPAPRPPLRSGQCLQAAASDPVKRISGATDSGSTDPLPPSPAAPAGKATEAEEPPAWRRDEGVEEAVANDLFSQTLSDAAEGKKVAAPVQVACQPLPSSLRPGAPCSERLISPHSSTALTMKASLTAGLQQKPSLLPHFALPNLPSGQSSGQASRCLDTEARPCLFQSSSARPDPSDPPVSGTVRPADVGPVKRLSAICRPVNFFGRGSDATTSRPPTTSATTTTTTTANPMWTLSPPGLRCSAPPVAAPSVKASVEAVSATVSAAMPAVGPVGQVGPAAQLSVSRPFSGAQSVSSPTSALGPSPERQGSKLMAPAATPSAHGPQGK